MVSTGREPHGADLDQRSQSVWDAPMFDDLPGYYTQDIEDGDAHRAARGRVAQERTVVRPGRHIPRPHQVARDANVLNGQPEVGEGAVEGCHDCLDPFGACRVIGTIVLVL